MSALYAPVAAVVKNPDPEQEANVTVLSAKTAETAADQDVVMTVSIVTNRDVAARSVRTAVSAENPDVVITVLAIRPNAERAGAKTAKNVNDAVTAGAVTSPEPDPEINAPA